MAPVLLRFVAALNGARCAWIPGGSGADTRGYDYLELGCGLGATLATLAAANPEGRFVGVDMAPAHIAAARDRAAAGGLGNVRFIERAFGSLLLEDLPEFDMVALHGVWSWIGPEERDQILAILRNRLKPGGLVLISYNALPGWAHLAPIRAILRSYAQLQSGDTATRVREGMRYLMHIRDQGAAYFETNPAAARYVDSLLRQDVAYVAHEFLNEHWTPFYVSDVVASLHRIGLGFCGSLPVRANFWDLCVKPAFQEVLSTTTDRLVLEAHKDFVANTMFRWDLFRRPETAGAAPTADPTAIDSTRLVAPRPDLPLPHRIDFGPVTSTVEGPLYEALLAEAGGPGASLAELESRPRLSRFGSEAVRRGAAVATALGLLEVARTSAVLPSAAGGPLRPAGTYNRAMLAEAVAAGRGVALASPVIGNGIALNELEAPILGAVLQSGGAPADERSVAAVVGALESAGRQVLVDGKPAPDAAARNRAVADAIDTVRTETVPRLVRFGVLEAA